MRFTNWMAILTLVLGLIWAGLGSSVAAQGLLGSTATPSERPTDISDIIDRAAESGMGVIVIDTDGNVLSPVPEREATEADSMSTDTALMKAQESADAFRDALFSQISQLPVAINEVAYILRATSPDGTIMAYVKVLLYSLGLFAIGMVAQKHIYGRHIASHFILPMIRENPHGYSGKMPFLTVRFIGQVIGILFSMAVAYAIGFLIFGALEDPSLQYTATLINIGYFGARVMTAAWRMILSPYLSQYRIPHLSDADSLRLFLWLSATVSIGFFTMLFSWWVRQLGLNEQLFVFIASLLSFVVLLLNVLMVLVNRRAITGAILNGADAKTASWPLRLLARAWVPFVLAYLIFGWGENVYDLVLGLPPGIPLIAGAYGILTVVLVVYGVINYFIERSFARARAMRAMNMPEDETAPSEDMPEQLADLPRPQITTFEDLARRIAGIIAFVAGVWAFVSIWEPDTGMMTGETLPDRTLDVIVILFLGYIAYTAFRIWIDAKIAEEQGEEVEVELGDEGSGSSASRLATLLPLFRNFVLIVIVVTVILIVLMELGVNVGPLFAGAGIVGVAVGFGSQTLVRDIFSGAFFLFDDAFRKGEYIEIGDVRGTVEKISVRSFQLRHHLGKLHTIPFGEIQVLTNYSRDWVMMKLPLRVTYDTDVEKVRKLIKKLGLALLEDPVIGADFIQPLKSQGVIEMQDSAMIIRVKFMTKPGDQWVIRKRVFQEIRDLFEREGIKFAHREVTVRLADGDAEKLTPNQKEAVLAAAEASLEEDDGPDMDRGDDR